MGKYTDHQIINMKHCKCYIVGKIVLGNFWAECQAFENCDKLFQKGVFDITVKMEQFSDKIGNCQKLANSDTT